MSEISGVCAIVVFYFNLQVLDKISDASLVFNCYIRKDLQMLNTVLVWFNGLSKTLTVKKPYNLDCLWTRFHRINQSECETVQARMHITIMSWFTVSYIQRLVYDTLYRTYNGWFMTNCIVHTTVGLWHTVSYIQRLVYDILYRTYNGWFMTYCIFQQKVG